MKIAVFVNTPEGMEILAKTHSLDKTLEILKKVKADGILLDIQTAKKLLSENLLDLPPSRSHITAKTHHRIQRVPVEEVIYFQADQKYITVYHLQGTLLIEDTLKNLEHEFSEQFIRIHRHLLVRTNEIAAIEQNEAGQYWLKLKHSDILLPISRRKIASVRRQIIDT